MITALSYSYTAAASHIWRGYYPELATFPTLNVNLVPHLTLTEETSISLMFWSFFSPTCGTFRALVTFAWHTCWTKRNKRTYNSILIQTMDKEEPKFENKYFFSSLKKEKTEQYLCVFHVRALSEALRNMDNTLFSMGMQSIGSQDPWQKTLWSSSHSHVGRWVEDDNVNIHWSKGFRDRSLRRAFIQTGPCAFFCFFVSLGHVVVLVGVLLVTFHIVPVNKRLYPLLQVSRLKVREDREGVNTWQYF